MHDHANKTRLPKRVIDVEGLNGRPRLLVADGKCGLYTALSYCWGIPQSGIMTLTSANLHNLQSEIPSGRLPQTIRDAISITKDLGFRYLWVDRLCIVQDDRSDWEEEAAQMCNIYERATLTLAAVGERDSSGLYPANHTKPLLNCGTGDDDLGRMHVGRTEHPDLDKDLKESRWAKRGWTFQERILSRRLVYFGERLSWECHEMTDPAKPKPLFANDRPTHDRLVTYGTKLQILRDVKDAGWELLVRTLRLSPNQFVTWRKLWYRIVTHYTSREFTYGSDRIPALAGLVQTLQARMPRADYFFGHWINLVGFGSAGLVWTFDHKLRRNPQRLAPQKGTSPDHHAPSSFRLTSP